MNSIKKDDFYKISPQEALAELETSLDGLNTEEVKAREKIYGKNILSGFHKTPRFVKFLRQFKDVLIILLIIADIISLYLHDYRGVTVVTIIILINAIIGYAQEAKAERIMESLKKMLHPNVKVKRNGELKEELAEYLVPGDIVYVEEGDSIPADMRIIEESEFQTNDFSLTGESNPQNKYIHEIEGDVLLSERNNCVWMGTTVATGYARCVVFATGMDTQLGRIANLSQEQILEETPLQMEMKNISEKLTIGTIILGVVLLIISLIADLSLKEAFIFAIGICIAMIPQGLPTQVSIALTLAANRLAKNKALVKQLASVETLGCVNVICTDKTGTLTKNEMTVKHFWLGFHVYDVEGDGYEPIGHIIDSSTHHPVKDEFMITWKHFFYGLFLNVNAKIHGPDEEHLTRYSIGDPTEAALISLAQKAKYDTEHLDKMYSQIRQYGFDSVRKRMSTIRIIDDQRYIYVKGAPLALLEQCTRIYDGKNIRKITQEDKKQIEVYIEHQANNAMRNLGIAYKPLDTFDSKRKRQDVEHELIFLGCVSIIDPPRDEVPAAVQAAFDAKVKIIMITGDYGLTAEAIARRIGLEDREKVIVVTGEQLSNITDIQLSQLLQKPKSLIFSRTSPEDKLRIVTLLKKMNNIIAVTGDGINDAPALKAAHIGVAMGKIGTDVAKDASEIVLLDDSFHTLVFAIREGRIIFHNLKKTILSCITSNGGELFAVLPSLVTHAIWGLPISITPLQILAIDMVGEMGPLTALTWDPPQNDLMKQGPRNIKDHIINRPVIWDLIFSGLLMGGIAFGNYLLYILLHGFTFASFDATLPVYTTATSITYTSIIFCQFANILSRRAGKESVFTSYIRSNKKLLFTFGLSLALILLLLYAPVIPSYFSFGPMDLKDRMFPIVGGMVYLFIRETKKYFQRKNSTNRK